MNATASALEQSIHEAGGERDKVAALLGARRELVAGVSHRPRTPVATMHAYLESLQGNLTSAQIRILCHLERPPGPVDVTP